LTAGLLNSIQKALAGFAMYLSHRYKNVDDCWEVLQKTPKGMKDSQSSFKLTKFL